MPTISPFGLDGNPKSLKVIIPLCYQVQMVMLPLSLCWNLCSIVLSMLPLTVGKVCKKKIHDFIHHKWPSYHQRLIHTSISQPSGDIPILTHLPNQVGIHQKFTQDKVITLHHPPKHSGETKVGRYMTLTRKEIHDIETKYLQQDYDSHQKLSLATFVNHHSNQQPCSSSSSVPPETKNNCEIEPRSSKIMPTMHY